MAICLVWPCVKCRYRILRRSPPVPSNRGRSTSRYHDVAPAIIGGAPHAGAVHPKPGDLVTGRQARLLDVALEVTPPRDASREADTVQGPMSAVQLSKLAPSGLYMCVPDVPEGEDCGVRGHAIAVVRRHLRRPWVKRPRPSIDAPLQARGHSNKREGSEDDRGAEEAASPARPRRCASLPGGSILHSGIIGAGRRKLIGPLVYCWPCTPGCGALDMKGRTPPGSLASAPVTSCPPANHGRSCIPSSPPRAVESPRWAAVCRSRTRARSSPASDSAAERRTRTLPSSKRR